MIGLAALCLAVALAVALLILLIARATGWRRRRIGMLVRPWLLAILILLTIGLAAEASDGIAALSRTGWLIGWAWLAISLSIHLMGPRSARSRPAQLWGARVAHAGIAIAVGGILLSSLFSSTTERALAPGETLRFTSWTVQLHEVWPAAGAGWAGVAAELRASSGGGVEILAPDWQSGFDKITRSGPASLRSGSGLLTATIGPRNAEGRWPIRLRSTPLLVLIPVGLIIAALGSLAAMVGPAMIRRRRLKQARLATAWWA